MKTRPHIRAATPADEAALRQLMCATPLPGPVSVTLEREPSWSEGVLAAERDWTLAGFERGRAMGCGSRILRRVWWQGGPAMAAYLGDLRLHPEWRRRAGWLLRHGYRMLEEESAAHPAVVTWSAIFESNTAARRALFGARAGLPEYVDRGRLLCPGLFVREAHKRRSLMHPGGGVTLERGETSRWDEIAAFLNEQHASRPLAPVHDGQAFRSGIKWPGLRAGDFILARRGGELCACAAVWDVRAVRQVRVQAVNGALRFARLPLWLMHHLSGWPALPQRGGVLAAGYVSGFAVRDGDAPLAAALLRAARGLAAERGLSWLFVCLHEHDPLARALDALPGISASGRLCEVRVGGRVLEWPHGVPVIEPALL